MNRVIGGEYIQQIQFYKSECGKYDCFFGKYLGTCFTATNKEGYWEIIQEDIFRNPYVKQAVEKGIADLYKELQPV